MQRDKSETYVKTFVLSGQVNKRMLSERICELLSAYVDGELNARQVEAVRQVLRMSPEARSHLEKLRADAARMRLLSRRRVAKDLAGVVPTLAARSRARIDAARVSLAERTLPPWIGFPAAAAVLGAVFCGSYFYFFADRRSSGVPGTIVSRADDAERVATAAEPSPSPSAPAHLDEELSTHTEAERPRPRDIAAASAPTPNAFTPPKQALKASRKELDGVLTTPSVSEARFEMVDPATVMAVVLRDLDEKPLRQKLQSALKPNEAYRLELTGSSNAKALDVVTKAFQAQGVQFSIEELAQQRSRLPRSMTDYAVLTDDLTPAELVDVLARLGKADRDAGAKRADAARFHDVIVLPCTQDDHKEVAKLLGVEQAQVTSSGRSAEGASPRQVLLLTYNPSRPQPGASKEIKRFLEARAPARPDTVKIILVFRGVIS